MSQLNTDYEISNENEISDILAEMPLELIKANLVAQIQDPLLTKVDNLTQNINKFELLLKDATDADDQRELLLAEADMLRLVIDTISAVYDLGCNYDEDSVADMKEIAIALYESLIMAYKQNITDFLYSYIRRHGEELCQSLVDEDKKKELFAKKKDLSEADKEKVLTLLQLPVIFKQIYSMQIEISPEEFILNTEMINLSAGDKLYDLMTTGIVCGSFVPKYMKLLVNKYDETKAEIFNQVRIRMIQDCRNALYENK